MKNPSINFILLAATLVFLIFSGCGSKEAENPKNVIVFLVDDLGWTDLGCYGSKFYESHRIDAFAKEAARFTNAYTPNPVCSPTRAAILTGRYPSRVNITDWIPGMTPRNPTLKTPEDRYNLALSEVTLAEALKEHGYQTFYAGKWHLGDEGHYPQNQGFDINKGGHDKGSPPGGYYAPFNNPQLEVKEDDHYLTDRLTNECINFLETRSAEKPFLLYLSYYTVHTPIQGWDEFDAYFLEKKSKLPNGGKPKVRSEQNGNTLLTQSGHKYAAMVKALDNSVGRILDTLKVQGLDKDTVIVFSSDNGGLSTKTVPGPTSVLPLRAGKGWCYEGGIRVPLLIRSPSIDTSNTTIDTPVISMDYFPTILDLAGLPARPDLHTDGVSLKPLLEGGEIEDRSLFWHYPHYHGSAWTPGAAVRVGDWKLIQFYEYDKIELYNLAADIEEMNDLSKSNPEKTAELLAELKRLQAETGSQIPMPIN
ncbi:MAG: arylsulfatase [Opitutaceae bacterium]|nr:arylsulfatase [Opitutaceae bacterium]|tara:strand:+ start:10303 stop:11736 length:1434 start_codon:yes stop_codon:yes gene_type:complete